VRKDELPPALEAQELRRKLSFSQNIKDSTFRLKSKRNFSLIIHRLKPVAIETFASKLDNELPPALARSCNFLAPIPI
jgi:hypothetical protein